MTRKASRIKVVQISHNRCRVSVEAHSTTSRIRNMKMTKTVVGLFDSLNTAQNVVKDLTNAGFRREDISLLANDAGNQYGTYLENPAETDDAVGTAEGAGFGAVVGALTGILAGLTALVIPGVGPVIAAGPIIGGGAGVGAG